MTLMSARLLIAVNQRALTGHISTGKSCMLLQHCFMTSRAGSCWFTTAYLRQIPVIYTSGRKEQQQHKLEEMVKAVDGVVVPASLGINVEAP